MKKIITIGLSLIPLSLAFCVLWYVYTGHDLLPGDDNFRWITLIIMSAISGGLIATLGSNN